jgi:signal transduction histidine kinase
MRTERRRHDASTVTVVSSPSTGKFSVNAATRLSDFWNTRLSAPSEVDEGAFGVARRISRERVFLTDSLLASLLLVASTLWLIDSPLASLDTALVQAALIVPLAWRRYQPTAVFCLLALIGLFEWLFGTPLIANGALLIALYSVAVHESRVRALAAAVVLEFGAILAATRWESAGTLLRSITFLSATVVAALCAGLAVRSGSEYVSWLAERAERLEVERDQRTSLAAAEERARIAREMHDIVAHSLSVVVSLADAATTVSQSDPERAAEAMQQASNVGRQALGDMRAIIGVLRTDRENADFDPQPGLGQLDGLVEQVANVGLAVELSIGGDEFVIGPAAELSVYRIVQESLTNIIKHSGSGRAQVDIRFARPKVFVNVANESGVNHQSGHRSRVHAKEGADMAIGMGIEGMRERVALHGGSVSAGPTSTGGWMVDAMLSPDLSSRSR